MSKSDKRAIMAYMQYLRKHGYENVIRIKTPSDICATKDDSKYYFEIKKTTKEKEDKYFGAATETEWAKAVEDSSKFKFVIVREDKNDDNKFYFSEYSLDEFRTFCSIPPFKIYFNIDMNTVSEESYEFKDEESGNSHSPKEANSDENNAKMSLNIKDDKDNMMFQDIHERFNSYREKDNGSINEGEI